jgi:hypothetical protein
MVAFTPEQAALREKIIWKNAFKTNVQEAQTEVDALLRAYSIGMLQRNKDYKLTTLLGPDGAKLVEMLEQLKERQSAPQPDGQDLLPGGLDFDFVPPVLSEEGGKEHARIKIMTAGTSYHVCIYPDEVKLTGLAGREDITIARLAGTAAEGNGAVANGADASHGASTEPHPLEALERNPLSGNDPRRPWVMQIMSVVIEFAVFSYGLALEHASQAQPGIRKPDEKGLAPLPGR